MLVLGSAAHAEENATSNTVVVASLDAQVEIADDQATEIVDGSIILSDFLDNEAAADSDDQQYSPMLFAHGCHKPNKCFIPYCPRCKLVQGSTNGHCQSGGKLFRCTR